LTFVKAAMGRSPHSQSLDGLGSGREFAVPCAATLSISANPEVVVILEQLLLGIMVVAFVLLLLPLLLVMAGVGAAMLLWFVASAAVLGALVFLAGVSRDLWARGPAACTGHRAAPCR
jgi:hypothetical protein